MIDLHCHFLPGIDDGPKTMNEALALARAAVANGITHSVMTPHIQPGTWNNDLTTITPIFEQYQQQLKGNNIPLSISMAAEVRICPEVLPLITDGNIPFLGEYEGYKLMLLEFPHSHISVGSDKMIKWLFDRNIRPVIAHPERNKDVMRKLEKIKPFIDMGCYTQVTAGSITGTFGDRAYKTAHQMLEHDWITVIATDAHNLEHRPPDLQAGYDAIAEHKNADDVKSMLEISLVWANSSEHHFFKQSE